MVRPGYAYHVKELNVAHGVGSAVVCAGHDKWWSPQLRRMHSPPITWFVFVPLVYVQAEEEQQPQRRGRQQQRTEPESRKDQ
jgi:hypothetical protein